MSECRWTPRVERWFDGESAEAEMVEQHLAVCAVCAEHLARLQVIRGGAEAVAVREAIGEPQLPAFIDGIRERVERPVRWRAGFWTLVSLSAGALIVALSTLYLLTGGPQEALATEVESYSTELEGATVTTYLSEDGTATVWVSMPEKELR